MSSIRVNPYPMPDILSALENLQQQQATATQELATGSKINQPSDDPAGAAELVLIQEASSQNDSYQQSIGSINGQLSTADSTLASVVSVLQRALSLGVEGANGTLSDTDRTDIASELEGIQSQLLSLANTSYQNQFLFAGTANQQPFVQTGGSASGVTYQGNSGTNFVTIGSGYQLQVNLPGSQIFNGPNGADVFQAISDLISAMQNNSGISDAVTEVTNAYNYVTAQRVFYGNAMNQTQSQQTFLSTESVNISQQQNSAAGTDMAVVASQLASDQTAANATLEAIDTLPRNTLFDYLR
jgi:flagellar hook-associated protein 3 FlgL